jgi:hypothetical protein
MRALHPTLLALSCALACEPVEGERVEVHGGECASCHADDKAMTVSPPHAVTMFGDDCGTCHQQSAWRPAPGYAHTAKFPLEGGHESQQCASCHGGGYTPGMVPNQCVDCHAARAGTVVDPEHAGLGTNCVTCHDTAAFNPSIFVHPWELEGVHATLACSSCHGAMPAVYPGKSQACITCHAADRERADMNITDHAGYSEDCASCHGFDAF